MRAKKIYISKKELIEKIKVGTAYPYFQTRDGKFTEKEIKCLCDGYNMAWNTIERHIDKLFEERGLKHHV